MQSICRWARDVAPEDSAIYRKNAAHIAQPPTTAHHGPKVPCTYGYKEPREAVRFANKLICQATHNIPSVAVRKVMQADLPEVSNRTTIVGVAVGAMPACDEIRLNCVLQLSVSRLPFQRPSAAPAPRL